MNSSPGRNVTVPIRMPEGQPRLEHRADRIVYNYGDYTIEARFLTDGSVDVVYNTGTFGRALGWCFRP